MKKLICAKEVEELNKKGQKTFYIDSDTIITPSAKDAAKAYGMKFSTEKGCCTPACNPVITGEGSIDSNMIYTVLKAMMDKGQLTGIFDTPEGRPYVADIDSSGIKIVRGKTVKFDVFDTGNSSDKVFYQEIINKDDGSSMNAGFITIEGCSFDWDVACEELYHVVEGTLTVGINGKVYTAKPGDSVFFPIGTKVAFGSPDKMKAFYATY